MSNFAYGATLTISATSSSTGTAVASLKNIGSPNISVDALDVTVHSASSATDAYWRTFIKGLREAGEVSFDGNFSYANGSAIMTNINSTANSYFTVSLPTTTTAYWYFWGFVNSFEVGAPHDGLIDFSAAVKVSGQPTLSTTS
jgi:hypothetical protein